MTSTASTALDSSACFQSAVTAPPSSAFFLISASLVHAYSMSPFFAMLCSLRYFLDFNRRSRKGCRHGDDTLLDVCGDHGLEDCAAALAAHPDRMAARDPEGLCILLIDGDCRVGPFADNGGGVDGQGAHGPLGGDHERELCADCFACLEVNCSKGCLAVLGSELVSVEDRG